MPKLRKSIKIEDIRERVQLYYWNIGKTAPISADEVNTHASTFNYEINLLHHLRSLLYFWDIIDVETSETLIDVYFNDTLSRHARYTTMVQILLANL